MNQNHDYIAKIDINKHPEFKNLDCHYANCDYKGETFEKLVDHVHSVHVSQEGSDGPKVSWLISDLIPKKTEKFEFSKNFVAMFLSVKN